MSSLGLPQSCHFDREFRGENIHTMQQPHAYRDFSACSRRNHYLPATGQLHLNASGDRLSDERQKKK